MPSTPLPTLDRMLEAVREADSAARLRALIAPVSPFPDILVVTLTGITEARREVGNGAGAVELIRALDGLTGGNGEPWGDGGEGEGRRARGIVAEMQKFAASGTSVAFTRWGAVLVNASRLPGIVQRALTKGGCPLRAIKAGMDLVALHEVGHIAEIVLRHHIPSRDWREVPSFATYRVREDGEARLQKAPPREKLDTSTDAHLSLRAALQWHSSECYADAFQVAASLASGATPEEAMLEIADGTARCCDLGYRAALNRDAFWSGAPLWPGIYCTTAAAAAVLRDPPRSGAGIHEVATVARRSARRGSLTPEMLAEFAFGSGAPDWLADLDPTGCLDRAIAFVGVPFVGPALPIPMGGDATTTLLGTIAATALSPHSSARDAAREAAVRRWTAEVLDPGEPLSRAHCA